MENCYMKFSKVGGRLVWLCSWYFRQYNVAWARYLGTANLLRTQIDDVASCMPTSLTITFIMKRWWVELFQWWDGWDNHKCPCNRFLWLPASLICLQELSYNIFFNRQTIGTPCSQLYKYDMLFEFQVGMMPEYLMLAVEQDWWWQRFVILAVV